MAPIHSYSPPLAVRADLPGRARTNKKAAALRSLWTNLARRLRGVGGSRTHDVGFAIRCLSHLATTPYANVKITKTTSTIAGRRLA